MAASRINIVKIAIGIIAGSEGGQVDRLINLEIKSTWLRMGLNVQCHSSI